jgi:hypothetical protein
MFERNRSMVVLVYTRILLSFAALAITISGTYWAVMLKDNCLVEGINSDLSNLAHLLIAILVMSYFVCVFSLLFHFCAIVNHVDNSIDSDKRNWTNRLSCICCCMDQFGMDSSTYDSLAEIFARVFHMDNDNHFVPSDIATGAILVRGAQRNARNMGHLFFVPESQDRWELERLKQKYLHSGKSKDANYQGNSSSSNEIDVDRPWLVECLSTMDVSSNRDQRKVWAKATQIAKHANNASLIAAPSSPPGTSPRDSSPKAQQHDSNALGVTVIDIPTGNALHGTPFFTREMAEKRNVSSAMLDDLENGQQPSLEVEDWDRIASAQYYSKYAMGAYGWPLYAFDYPASCLLTCKAFSCSFGRPDGPLNCSCCHTFSAGQLRGSGCFDSFCCNQDAKSFLLRTGIQPEHIIYANLENKIGQSVFYVAQDIASKRLVIACRGTLSLSDAITDLNAEMVPFHGSPQYKAHKGIMNNTKHVYSELVNRVQIGQWLEDHEDYSLMVVGHSLGAAVASYLTVMLSKQFPSVKCIAYAPPMLMDKQLSHKTRSSITSIIYNHDIIAHLSLSSIFKLKQQMLKSFQVCIPQKFAILSYSLSDNHDAMFNCQDKVVAAQLLRARNEAEIDFDGKLESSNENSAFKSGGLHNSTLHSHSTLSLATESSNELNFLAHDGFSKITTRGSAYSEDYTCTPGRIYHILPTRKNQTCTQELTKNCCGKLAYVCTCLCCCVENRPEVIVYPADQRTFNEIYMAGSMFPDHLPHHYRLDTLKFPPKFQSAVSTLW